MSKFLEFEEARQIVRQLSLKNVYEWHSYCKSGRPKNIPSNPQKAYVDKWEGMSDWLGNGNNQRRVEIPCEQCHKPFSVKKSLLASRRFCSWECICKHRNQSKITKQCEYCGADILDARSDTEIRRRSVYCSQKCNGSAKKIQFTDSDIQRIIDRHVSGHEVPNTIADDYGCSRPLIAKLLQDEEVYRAYGCRKYFFNEEYFAKIDTPRKAYWLGLFYADASVSDNYVLALGLKREDRYILERLASDVGYTGDLYDVKQVKSINGGEEKPYPASILALCSKKLTADLEDKGVVCNKTFRLEFPSISYDLRRHFIRGLMDGDGFISVTWWQDRHRPNRRPNWQYTWGIVGQEKLLRAVRSVLEEEIGVNVSLYKNSESLWSIRCATIKSELIESGSRNRIDDLILIRNWLYEDACIYFKRKKTKFDLIQPTPRTTGMSISDAANYLGVSIGSLRWLISSGRISSYKEGRFRRITIENVDDLKSTLGVKK